MSVAFRGDEFAVPDDDEVMVLGPRRVRQVARARGQQWKTGLSLEEETNTNHDRVWR